MKNEPPRLNTIREPRHSSFQSPPDFPRPHRLHIYSTKHNTHITLTKPNRNPIFALSTGILRFKKAQRGTYDAAYQLAVYALGQMRKLGLLGPVGMVERGGGYGGGTARGGEAGEGVGGDVITSLELVLRDFGPGREAATKVLLGSEGAVVRARCVRVMDATRLKFGGTRGDNKRRI
ncbi:uncharacterized protein KY384_009218 [Bacidia gigantensis]|uniref:uncharacterized protein n=1 Tax=Bacidia gigantensis TaxID=2732470 RepID=UPI001D041713|nr:uncharacterized protein KY384_009218 [Bacidia gigantensis]KAG8525574.1 hypothetical protein KY384_009218 [Bacidia gigantensis]